jgi:hypothetical protein
MPDDKNIEKGSIPENNQNEIVEPKSFEKNNNPMDEFASGLPSWDLTPPLMVIKRVKRNI